MKIYLAAFSALGDPSRWASLKRKKQPSILISYYYIKPGEAIEAWPMNPEQTTQVDTIKKFKRRL